MFYFGILTLFLIIYFIPKLKSKYKFGLIFVVLSCMIFIRRGIGADYYSYYFLYESLDSSSFVNAIASVDRIEPGFKAIMYLFKALGASPHIFLASTSFFIFTVFSLWIHKNSKDKVLSLILFFAIFFNVWSLSALRQGIVLAIGTCFFFSRDREISLSKSIWIILGLTTIHASALVYIPIVVFNNVYISNKKIVYFLITTIVLSFIPLYKIGPAFSFIPGIRKVLANVDQGIPLFNFSYLVRFGFSIASIYVLLQKNKSIYLTKITKTFIFGFGLYFLISFSELIGSRAGIYTYILLVILIPEVTHSNIVLFNRPQLNLRLITIGASIVFMFLSVYKETSSLKTQTQYLGKEKFMPFTTVFNSKSSDFGSKFAHIISREDYENELYLEFNNNLNTEVEVKFDSSKNHDLVYSDLKQQSYIINEEGEIVYNQKIPGDLTLYNDVITSDWQLKLLKDLRFFDVANKGRSIEEMKTVILEEMKEDLDFKQIIEKQTEYKFIDLPENTQALFSNIDALQDVYIYEYLEPFQYYIMAAEYQYYKHYIYLDENLEPLTDLMFIGKAKFNRNGILKIRFQDRDVLINKNGELIWIN